VNPGQSANTSSASRGNRRLPRWLSRLLKFSLFCVAIVGLPLYWATDWGASLGGKVEGDRLARVNASPNFEDGKAKNLVPTNLSMERDAWGATVEWVRGAKRRKPPGPVPVVTPDVETLAAVRENGVRFIWIGHSTVYLEIDGTRVLIDPVWAEIVSPLKIVGLKRSHPVPIPLNGLPDVDVVVISHDHLDHLDMAVVRWLAPRGVVFAVPLGVGAHLESWDVPADQIIELDWWEGTAVGSLALIATPARHFSGRWLTDLNRTLWASWTMIGPESRVFYSGDTGWQDEFEQIGDNYGPFDLTIIKCGAYDDAWPDIHLNGIQAVEANVVLKGRRMLPVHWLTFDLALHPWDEPIRQVVETASELGVDVITPQVGEIVDLESRREWPRWWDEMIHSPEPRVGIDEGS
jgi:L-ascorbate metabolism protein UlaG (beta-lactamase superfamily)